MLTNKKTFSYKKKEKASYLLSSSKADKLYVNWHHFCNRRLPGFVGHIPPPLLIRAIAILSCINPTTIHNPRQLLF